MLVQDTKSIQHKHTLPVQRRLINNRHKRVVTELDRATGYRHSCSLTRNTWYKTTSRVGHENRMVRIRVQPWPSEVQMRCGLHTSSN